MSVMGCLAASSQIAIMPQPMSTPTLPVSGALSRKNPPDRRALSVMAVGHDGDMLQHERHRSRVENLLLRCQRDRVPREEDNRLVIDRLHDIEANGVRRVGQGTLDSPKPMSSRGLPRMAVWPGRAFRRGCAGRRSDAVSAGVQLWAGGAYQVASLTLSRRLSVTDPKIGRSERRQPTRSI